MSETSHQETDAGTPQALRGLLLRIGGTLIGLLLLYVLSTGPVAYYIGRHQAHDPDAEYPLLNRLYAPLEMIPEDGVLGACYFGYVTWWYDLAQPAKEEAAPVED